jgi:hypothetical protein
MLRRRKMIRPIVRFSDYVSLAVMLLMVVALVTGQADASSYANGEESPVAAIAAMEDRINIDFEGQLSDTALKISIAIVTDLSHFRGEDE